MRRALCLVVGCLGTLGCQPLVAPAAAAESPLLWMSQTFSWGTQCSDKQPNAPGQHSALPSRDAGPAPLLQQLRECFPSDAAQDAAMTCVAKALAGAGVVVRDRRVEPMSVCEACGCPAQSVRLLVSVPASAKVVLEGAGFTVRKRPPPP